MSGLLKRLFRTFQSAPHTIVGPIRSPALGSLVIHATARGPLLVEILSMPFDESRSDATAAVLAALVKPLLARPLRFTADPQKAPEANVRLILAFHPAPGLSPDELARGKLLTIPPPADRLSLLAVLASGNDTLASVEGWAAGFGTSSDPRFAALLHQAIRLMLGDV